jgi:hypothetical protein
MLVSVKYGIPGEVRPIMYSDVHEALLFSTEMLEQPDELDSDPVSDAPDTRTAQPQKHAQDGGFVLLLKCRTFELWTYDPDASVFPQHAQELVLLSPTPPRPTREGVPMLRARPPSRRFCGGDVWGSTTWNIVSQGRLCVHTRIGGTGTLNLLDQLPGYN